MDAGLLMGTGGLLVGGAAAGLYAALVLDRHAKRLAEHDRRIRGLQDVVLHQAAQLAAADTTLGRVRRVLDRKDETARRAAPPPGLAAHACTDVAACDNPDRCDEGCLRAIGPVETAGPAETVILPIGFPHPDDEDKGNG